MLTSQLIKARSSHLTSERIQHQTNDLHTELNEPPSRWVSVLEDAAILSCSSHCNQDFVFTTSETEQ